MFELLSGFRFLCTMTHRCCKQMVCIENRFSHHKIRSFQAIEITLFTDAEFLLRHTSVCRAYEHTLVEIGRVPLQLKRIFFVMHISMVLECFSNWWESLAWRIYPVSAVFQFRIASHSQRVRIRENSIQPLAIAAMGHITCVVISVR